MIETEIKYIQHTKFQLLENWSVQYLIESTFLYNPIYKLVKIGDFLLRSRDQVKIENGKNYQRVTIKINNGGVFPRDIELGERIGTKLQYRVSEGQFLMSKIDARNGAFGIVTKQLEGAVVTNDFPAFNVNTKIINPGFLVLITTTKAFVKFAQSCSSGTTNRQRIDISAFLNVKIPLPTLEEQNLIVEAYNKRIAEAERLEAEAKQLEEGIEKYLFEVLEIKKTGKERHKKSTISLVSFSNINIWSVWNINKAYVSQKYPSVNIGKILSLRSGSFLPAKSQLQGEYNVYGGNGINGTHNTYIHEGKNIVIGRVGEKCGNVHLVEGKYWVTDNAFITEKINDNFLIEYLSEILSYLDLNRFKVISAQPSLSQNNIVNIPVPFPPISVQKEIISSIEGLRIEIEKRRTKSNINRQQAITEFESKIFMPCN
jgi:type I restriction enzyme, S subunit